jgi:membrane protein involved in colicin uptake
MARNGNVYRYRSCVSGYSDKAKEEDVWQFLREISNLKNPGDCANADAVFEVSLLANEDLYEKIRRHGTMGKATEKTLREMLIEGKEELRREKEILQKERESVRQEKESVRQEKESVRQEKESVRQEKEIAWKIQEDAKKEVLEVQKEAQKAVQKANLLSIQSLMENLKMTAEQAMDAIGIPQEQRSVYEEFDVK